MYPHTIENGAGERLTFLRRAPTDAIAAALALVGDSEHAIEWMRRSSLVRGWIDYPLWSEQDSLVSRLAPDPEYQAGISEIKRRWEAALRPDPRFP